MDSRKSSSPRRSERTALINRWESEHPNEDPAYPSISCSRPLYIARDGTGEKSEAAGQECGQAARDSQGRRKSRGRLVSLHRFEGQEVDLSANAVRSLKGRRCPRHEAEG